MPSTGPLWLAAYTFATVENDITCDQVTRKQNAKICFGVFIFYFFKKTSINVIFSRPWHRQKQLLVEAFTWRSYRG
jgi:hypothetical protein